MRVNTLLDMFCPNHKFLLFNLVTRNLKLKYRKSILGIFWTMLGPGLSAIIYFLIFKFVMKVTIPNYLLFLLIGLLPWTFFVTSLNNGLESLVMNQSLLNKIPLPIHSLPLSETATGLINFTLSLPVLLIVALISNATLSVSALLFPYLMLLLFLQAYGYAILLGIYFVYLRDLRHVLVIIIQVWFYITPIIYEEKMIPAELSIIKFLNPVFFIFSGIHDVVVFNRWPPLETLAVATTWTCALFLFSYYLLRKNQNTVVEYL